MSQTTTPPNASEVDVLSVLTVAACSVASLANIRRDAGLNLAADIYEQESKEIDLARTVVAALLTREAALVARNADLEQGLASACHAGRGLSSICTEYRKQLEAMTAERDALAAEVGALREACEFTLKYLNGHKAMCNEDQRAILTSALAARAEAGHG